MKLTYLGTAAAEGFPAVFCNCVHCQEARKLGGKNIRTRSQALINDDLLIDLPADTYHHFLTNGIEGGKIRYLLFTHSHGDHCYPTELSMRKSPFGHDMQAPVLDVYAGSGAFEKVMQSPIPPSVSVHKIAAYETVELGRYRVTALPAKHADEDGALFYLIQSDATLLYAHDTGYFFEEVITYLEKEKLVLDLVSFDCTNVDIPISDEGRHMGIPNILRLEGKLREIGCITDSTVKVINHFSHNARPIHHELEKRVCELGYLVSYDGRTISLP